MLSRWQQAGEGYNQTQVTDMPSAFARAARGSRGICLADLALTKAGELSAFIKEHPSWFTIAMSVVPADVEGLTLLRSGARGYANRLMSPELLHNVIGLVASGEVWAGQRLVAHLLSSMTPAQKEESLQMPPDLTRREKEITQLVASGESNKEIARVLEITERTVKAHISEIFKKTKTRSRVQLALLVKGKETADGHIRADTA